MDLPEAASRIIDIGGGDLQRSLRDVLEWKFLLKGKDGESKTNQRRLLPSSFLSDAIGLKMWHEINRLPNYYQTREEIELLDQRGKEIAGRIADGSVLIDIGCG